MKTRIGITFLLLVSSVCLRGQANANNNLLPEVKKLNYLPIPSSFENNDSNVTCLDSLYKSTKTYDQKLNDIGDCEVYLIKLKPRETSKTACMLIEKMELLFLFNKKTKEAHILVVAYEYLSDSEMHFMTFRIKSNQIEVTESAFTGGENGAEKYDAAKHKIKVLKDGFFEVSSSEQ